MRGTRMLTARRASIPDYYYDGHQLPQTQTPQEIKTARYPAEITCTQPECGERYVAFSPEDVIRHDQNRH